MKIMIITIIVVLNTCRNNIHILQRNVVLVRVICDIIVFHDRIHRGEMFCDGNRSFYQECQTDRQQHQRHHEHEVRLRVRGEREREG